MARTIASAIVAIALTACAVVQRSPEAPPQVVVPGASRIELPEALGTPVVVVAPELKAGVLEEGQQARFEIDFRIDERGTVIDSRVVSESRPDLQEAVRDRHRQWIYAVATRKEPCMVRTFTAVQRLDVERRDGVLRSSLEPARILEVTSTRSHPSAAEPALQQGLTVPNYAQVMRKIEYPRAALREGVEAKLALLVRFSAEGEVDDVVPVNALYDQWGFTASATKAARQLKASPPPGRQVFVCVPLTFEVR